MYAVNNLESFEKLKAEIAYSYDYVPLYKDHFDRAEVNPKGIDQMSDIQTIPCTEKKHYRKFFPKGVMSTNFKLSSPLYKLQSSGTMGERLITYELGFLYLLRSLTTMIVNPVFSSLFKKKNRRHCQYASPNCSDVECANPNRVMKDRIRSDGTLVLSVYHDLLTTPESTLEKNIEEIEAHCPELFFVDVTHLAFLARYMKKRGYQPPQVPIIATYTLPTKVSLRQINEVFPEASLAELCSMTELGFLSFECPQGKMHINNKSYYLEFVRQGREAQTGELAELVVSTLGKGACPKIRYRTGDLYRLLGDTCSCGSAYPVVLMEGRAKDALVHNNQIILTPREVDGAIGNPQWLDLYKLVQRNNNTLDLFMIVNEQFQLCMAKQLKTRIEDAIRIPMNIRLNVVNYIPTERSGKFLSCTSAIAEKNWSLMV